MHRARDLLVKQRTQLINMMRGLLAEFGIAIPDGLERALLMTRQVVDGAALDVPVQAGRIVSMLSQQALSTHAQLREIAPSHACIGPTIWPAASPPFRASARSALRHWPRLLPTLGNFAPGGSSPLGSD